MGGALSVLRILVAVYVFFDATRRGIGIFAALFLAVAAFYLPFVVIPLYLLFRMIPVRFQVHRGGFSPYRTHTATPNRTALCPKCGHENQVSATQCQHCQNTLSLS